jgi:hypothetical protein
MPFATQKAYFCRQKQKGGERFDVDSIVDTGFDSFSHSCGCRCRRERSRGKASRFNSFSCLGRRAGIDGPCRQRWPRSNVRLRAQLKYSATTQLGVDGNAGKT